MSHQLIFSQMRLYLSHQLWDRWIGASLLYSAFGVREKHDRDVTPAPLAYPRSRCLQLLLGPHCKLLRKTARVRVCVPATMCLLHLGSSRDELPVTAMVEYCSCFCGIINGSARCSDGECKLTLAPLPGIRDTGRSDACVNQARVLRHMFRICTFSMKEVPKQAFI